MYSGNYTKKGVLYFVLGYFTGVLSCILIFLAVFFLAGYPLKYYLGRKGVSFLKKPVLVMSAEFDYKIEVKDIKDGKPGSLESMRGKPFFAVFWHPDCIHCLSTLLTVEGLIKRLGERMTVITFTSAPLESVSQTLHYLSCSVPVYVMRGDKFEAVTGGNLPQGIVVNSSGRVVYKYVGSANWDDDEIVNALLSVE